MFYIFNVDGICIANANNAVNEEDLAMRNEIAIESDKIYEFGNIKLIDGEIQEVEK